MVSLPMELKFIWSSKPLLTNRALKWFLGRMLAFMVNAAIVSCKFLATSPAFVWLHACMRAQMPFQIADVVKWLFTETAGKWLFSCMSSQVNKEWILQFKYSAANIAIKCFNAAWRSFGNAVDFTHVAIGIVGPCKLLPTILARCMPRVPWPPVDKQWGLCYQFGRSIQISELHLKLVVRLVCQLF